MSPQLTRPTARPRCQRLRRSMLIAVLLSLSLLVGHPVIPLAQMTAHVACHRSMRGPAVAPCGRDKLQAAGAYRVYGDPVALVPGAEATLSVAPGLHAHPQPVRRGFLAPSEPRNQAHYAGHLVLIGWDIFHGHFCNCILAWHSA